MESKLNYTVVGLFVTSLLAGLIVFAYWLEKHEGNQKYDYYYVYMTESVSGLSIDASVKYLGVDVGSVVGITINPTNSEQVQLLLKIKQGIPVKLDTKATLRFYGVTGLAFLELMGGGNDSPTLKQDQSDDIPVIQASASTFSNIESTLNSLAENSADVLKKIDRLLSDDNLVHVNEILLETKSLLTELRQQQPKIAHLVDAGMRAGRSMEEAFEQVTLAANNVADMTKALEKNGNVIENQFALTLNEIDAASNSIEKMATSFNANYSNLGHKVSDEVEQSLIVFRQLLYQIDSLVIELRDATRSIEDSPSDLLFKRSQAKLGPGEEAKGE
ncbi:MAG: MCE family protein [Gammaproteobacteria bacterium]|nr:MCE family protein [Gammaproteobacteria bacterium]